MNSVRNVGIFLVFLGDFELMIIVRSLLVLLVPTSLFVGCAPSGPPMHTVTGTVTFDGQPVAVGDITFRDAAGQTRSYAGKIVNGAYSFESSPGSKIVEITAMREVPGKVDTSNPGEEVPLREQYIPASYNTETTLTADISADSKTADFSLTSD
jgi:hypothetical protein